MQKEDNSSDSRIEADSQNYFASKIGRIWSANSQEMDETMSFRRQKEDHLTWILNHAKKWDQMFWLIDFKLFFIFTKKSFWQCAMVRKCGYCRTMLFPTPRVLQGRNKKTHVSYCESHRLLMTFYRKNEVISWLKWALWNNDVCRGDKGFTAFSKIHVGWRHFNSIYPKRIWNRERAIVLQYLSIGKRVCAMPKCSTRFGKNSFEGSSCEHVNRES